MYTTLVAHYSTCFFLFYGIRKINKEPVHDVTTTLCRVLKLGRDCLVVNFIRRTDNIVNLNKWKKAHHRNHADERIVSFAAKTEILMLCFEKGPRTFFMITSLQATEDVFSKTGLRKLSNPPRQFPYQGRNHDRHVDIYEIQHQYLPSS